MPLTSVVATTTDELELAIVSPDGLSVHRLPTTGSVRIGRAEGNDVRIESPSVSRRHCILHLDPPLRIEDLGGANGTFVREASPGAPSGEGETVDLRQVSGQTTEILPGDCISLGTTLIVVRIRGGVREPEVPEGEAASDAEELVLRDPAMQKVYEQAGKAAQSPISVLLLGETGVGKEVLASAIHQQSPRAAGPFVPLNCAALSESLLESELFGHEKGAFTGAVSARAGIFEAARGGTVFLDEVGELPPSVQVKLLRVIEERKVTRIGARQSLAIDVRFVSATNRDLEAEVERGRFRQDLLFRLNGMTLTIPPLRERQREIVPLAHLLLARACRQLGRGAVPELSAPVVAVLERHAWPGNVRELRNVCDRALVLCVGNVIELEHLPAKLVDGSGPASTPVDSAALSAIDAAAATVGGAVSTDAMDRLRFEMEALERQRILDALAACAGNQTQAAELLGVSRRTLVTKLGTYGVPRPRKRP